MHSIQTNEEGFLRSLVFRAMEIWWAFAAFATLLSLVAFPLYKGVILGYVPVIVGFLLAVGLRRLPLGMKNLFTEVIYRTSATKWLLLILSLGTAARAAVIAFPPIPFSDHAIYFEYGSRVAAGNGFGELISWPPGQPALVAFAIWIGGSNVHWLSAFHAVLGLATAGIFYYGMRSYSEASARWGSLVAAVWPSLVLWNGTLGHETTDLLLLVVISLLAMRLTDADRRQWRICLSLGFLAGIMALVRPTALIIPVLIAITTWTNGHSIWRAMAKAGIIATIMAATISPWTIRNYLQFEEFCPISANFGNVLLSSNHPKSDGIYYQIPHIPGLKPCERDHFRARQAWTAIALDPMRFVALTVKRVVFMWGTDTSGLDFVLGEPPRGGDTAKKGLSFIMQVPWAALAIAWVVAARRNKHFLGPREPVNWLFVSLWIATIWTTHALVEPLSRHHLPLIPFLAAMVLPCYWNWVRGDSHPPAKPVNENRGGTGNLNMALGRRSVS